MQQFILIENEGAVEYGNSTKYISVAVVSIQWTKNK